MLKVHDAQHPRTHARRAAFAVTPKVSTAAAFDARNSVARVREEYYRMTGTWCTEPEALAAVYSVPEGAPLKMAVDNVCLGVLPTEAAAKDFAAMRDGLARAVGVMTRG